jgi:hypothetical protein
MSESFDAQTKPDTARTGIVDTRILAQVEKWMALIRELKQEHARR